MSLQLDVATPPQPAQWWADSVPVIEPPLPSPGAWAGGPSAVALSDGVALAYRLRRPVGDGRGYANVIAHSPDGVQFETVAILDKDAFGGESLERPALVRTPQGTWRVYVSVATPGTFHWRVDVVEAETLQGLASAPARTVLPGSATSAVKDPVVLHANDRWHLWASVHPLDDDAHTDRMTTDYAVSSDGITWQWQGTALAPRPHGWDARGVRISSVLSEGDGLIAYYDGRATAGENWEERTGVAVSADRFGFFTSLGEAPWLQSPYAPSGLRYLSIIELPDGRRRCYFEGTRADGAHELRTRLM